MFWIIENKEQLETFYLNEYKEVFVEIIPFHNNIHPILNDVSLIYIRPLSETKGYIICVDHSETLSIGETYIKRLFQQLETIYVRDKKSFLYYFQLNKVIDISSIKYVETPKTPIFDLFYRQHPNKTDINKIIPIVKHYEVCENIYNQLKEVLEAPKPEYVKFYNKGALAFFGIEKNGIKINTDIFYKYYEPNNDIYSIQNNIIYTQYNLNTTTRRPSNAYNGINFAALNKDNHSRASFIPRNNEFLEIDISAYHPTLAGHIIDYTFDNPDIHSEFAKMYGVSYSEAKELTFKQLYGGIFEEYKHLEFFQKVQSYIDKQWELFNNQGYIDTPVSNYRFEKSKLDKMNPQKLFNYILQNLETSINIQILLKIHKILLNKYSKVVLYTYDSFLIDYDEDEEDVLNQLKTIFNEMNLSIKINRGKDYDFKH
jgi:hypothetical protein